MGVIRAIKTVTERYVYLVHLTDTAALIGFGQFYFNERNQLLDDSLLASVERGRTSSIGEGSEFYGELVEIRLKEVVTGETLTRTARKKNYCWVEGLKPDTEYEYEVFVDSDPWVNQPLAHYSSDNVRTPLSKRYQNRFKTFPERTQSADCVFAVIGDYGSGEDVQFAVARALEDAVDKHGVRFIIATGDNIYKEAPGGVGSGAGDEGNDSGEEDDDWFYTFFQPYRFIINRVPVFPAIGNHDASETRGEGLDDRAALYDNLFVVERFNLPVGRGPGLFYSFTYGADVELICLDSSEEEGVIKQEGGEPKKRRVYTDYRHSQFIDEALRAGVSGRPRWRIPFLHHSPFSDGDRHGDDSGAQKVFSKKFKSCGAHVCFSGHSHNFQWLVDDTINYFVSGGAGKPEEVMTGWTRATLKAWGGHDKGHFLIVKIDSTSNVMEVIPYMENRSEVDLAKLSIFTDKEGTRRFREEIKVS